MLNSFDALLTICRSSDDILRNIFAGFGLVQTCIVNVDKRHAFVKMLTRTDAMAAKEGMERYKSTEMQLRVSELFAAIFPLGPTSSYLLTNSARPDGEWVLDLAIAATTRPASVLSPLNA